MPGDRGLAGRGGAYHARSLFGLFACGRALIFTGQRACDSRV
ncbi:hypothetical protein DM52_2196 [Burkholderia mallei]|nr:hypothetical protein DM52_2196 [Burkholderia mallei]